MKLHHEGRSELLILSIILLIINGCLIYFWGKNTFSYILLAASIAFFLIVLNFYRSPYRQFAGDTTKSIVSPADGKIVAIEEVFEPEYFNEKRLQVSVFMSPLNVHANWFPINGTVTLKKHHNGRFQAAYLPKSSTENERSTVVIRRDDGVEVLMRQVAGAMAKRIVTYPEVGERAHVDDHMGFIKLGSRVDVYLPLDTKVLVTLDQKVTGNQTVLAELPLRS